MVIGTFTSTVELIPESNQNQVKLTSQPNPLLTRLTSFHGVSCIILHMYLHFEYLISHLFRLYVLYSLSYIASTDTPRPSRNMGRKT